MNRELAVLVVLPEMIAIYLLARLIVALYVLRTSTLCVAVTGSYRIFKEHVICRRWIVSSIDSRLSAIPRSSCGHLINPILISKECMPSRLEVIMFRSSWYSSYGVAVLPTIRCIWCRCHGSMIRSHYHHALSLISCIVHHLDHESDWVLCLRWWDVVMSIVHLCATVLAYALWHATMCINVTMRSELPMESSDC